MKNSILLMAGLALGAVLLPGTAFAEKKTLFTATETDKTPNFPWFQGTDGNYYVFDGGATFDMVSDDEPRVAGHGEYSMYAIMDVTGALTLWGKFHSENTDGAWDGYWTGNLAEMTATLVGSGDYEGLVSRWNWVSGSGGILNWSGYIVENGPGDVPFKASAWRVEQFEPEVELIPLLGAERCLVLALHILHFRVHFVQHQLGQLGAEDVLRAVPPVVERRRNVVLVDVIDDIDRELRQVAQG